MTRLRKTRCWTVMSRPSRARQFACDRGPTRTDVPTPAGTLPVPPSRFARDDRASAGIELGIGAVAVLAIAMVALDVYSLTAAATASARAATTMADYVSVEMAPDGDQMAALGRYLYEKEFKAPAELVFLISAVQQPTGDDAAAVALWDDDTIRIGEAEETATLAQECKLRGQQGWRQALLSQGDDRSIVLTPNDVVVVVEVCAKLLRQGMLTSRVVTGNIYRLHALPARNTEQPPTQPVYSPAPDAEESTKPSPVESNALEDGAPAQWAYLDSPVAAPAAAAPKVA